MKILYITTPEPKPQGDFQEVMTLIGLREVLGDDCIDLPKKKVLYGDFSSTKKEDLHGWGFTLYKNPTMEIDDSLRDLGNFTMETCKLSKQEKNDR